jgi:hypothetical protein
MFLALDRRFDALVFVAVLVLTGVALETCNYKRKNHKSTVIYNPDTTKYIRTNKKVEVCSFVQINGHVFNTNCTWTS